MLINPEPEPQQRKSVHKELTLGFENTNSLRHSHPLVRQAKKIMSIGRETKASMRDIDSDSGC